MPRKRSGFFLSKVISACRVVGISSPANARFNKTNAVGQNNATELLILVGMGVCATVLRFANFPLAPLLIGFILGSMLEDNFSQSTRLYDGAQFILERPMTLGLLGLAAL